MPKAVVVAACAVLCACQPQVDKPAKEPEQVEEDGAGVSKEPAPAAARRTKITPTVKKPELPEFLIYHENEAIPGAWLAELFPEGMWRVRQVPLVPDAEGVYPEDGNFYLVTPLTLIPLAQQLKPAAWDEVLTDGVSPLFIGHSFDPENRQAMPWRWTPLVAMFHQPAEDGPQPADPLTWRAQENLWVVDQEAWLRGLWLKARNEDPNQPLPEHLTAAWSAFMKDSETRRGTVREIWEKMRETPGTAAWLPASVRLRETSSLPWFRWRIPPQGTMLLLEHGLQPDSSEHHDKAEELMRLLLSKKVQDKILETTGYFPVHKALGRETEGSRPELRTGEWLDRSEFLIGRLARVQRALPVVAEELEAVKETTPEPMSEETDGTEEERSPAEEVVAEKPAQTEQ